MSAFSAGVRIFSRSQFVHGAAHPIWELVGVLILVFLIVSLVSGAASEFIWGAGGLFANILVS